MPLVSLSLSTTLGLYRDRHYITCRDALYIPVEYLLYVQGQTLQVEMLCISWSQICGMYRDRHYSNLKCLSTEQVLRTFEVLVILHEIHDPSSSDRQ